jgi:hypothetical protein
VRLLAPPDFAHLCTMRSDLPNALGQLGSENPTS